MSPNGCVLRPPWRAAWMLKLLKAMVLSFAALPLAVADDSAVVIYPDAGGAYRGVFESIVQGIEDQRLKTRKIALRDDMTREEIAARVAASGAKTVIALGRQGVAAALDLPPDHSVFVSGIQMQPSGNRAINGILLAPDPALVLARLKNLAPAVRRVFVVYNSRNNEWLIKNVREDAAVSGIELVTRDAQDLRDRCAHFRRYLATPTDARTQSGLLMTIQYSVRTSCFRLSSKKHGTARFRYFRTTSAMSSGERCLRCSRITTPSVAAWRSSF